MTPEQQGLLRRNPVFSKIPSPKRKNTIRRSGGATAQPNKIVGFHCVPPDLQEIGWSITDDPYIIKWGARDMYVDLGASLLLAAEKEEVKIAVELKSFAGLSPMNDLENAVGQYIVYHDVLKKTNPERILYLAVDEEVSIANC